MAVDPRTPVMVGVGQFTERIDDPGYRGMSAVELATEATQAALADTGADVGAVAQGHRGVRRAAAVRDLHAVRRSPPLGCSDNYLRSVAQARRRRSGARGARAHRRQRPAEAGDGVRRRDRRGRHRGGADPRLRERFDGEVRSRAVTTSRTSPRHVGGQLEDRGYGFEQYMSEYTAKHGLTGAPVQYGLLDNARRARLGLSVDDYRTRMAELFAPFSKVAAKNPFSSSPVERSVDEIDHRHRREPDDLRPVSPVDGGPRSGEPGRGRAADVGGRRAPPRRRRGEVGVPARPRRPDRAGPAGPRRRQRQHLGETGGGRSASGRGHRHRRRGDVRPLQLLPVPGLRGVRRVRAGARRSARAHADRRTAVLRRPRQQLFTARDRRDGGRNAGQARDIRSCRRQRRRHEQVLGRGVLD